MKQKSVDFRKLLKGYRSGWVALSPDFEKVLFYAKTLPKVTKKAEAHGGKVYYFPTGETYSNFVGAS